MAEKRAAFSLRRRLALGFSKWRRLRTLRKVPSRSSFFFKRRRTLSTDSPFFSRISVNDSHFLSHDLRTSRSMRASTLRSGSARVGGNESMSTGNLREEDRCLQQACAAARRSYLNS